MLAAAAAAQTNSPPAAGPRSCEPLAEHDLRPRAQDAAWSLLHTRSASRPFLSQPHNLGSLRSPSTGFISQPSALNLQQPQMPPTPLPSMDTNEQEARPPMLMPHPSARSQKNPRELMINTVRQMMYVSGETAEPSVETTSIIEDIVRQQVIELVSCPPLPFVIPYRHVRPSGMRTGLLTRTMIASQLHRAGLAPRLQVHQHKRPHLPDPARPGQGVAAAHLPLVEGRAQERQGLG